MQCVNPFMECVFNLEITPRIPSKATPETQSLFSTFVIAFDFLLYFLI